MKLFMPNTHTSHKHTHAHTGKERSWGGGVNVDIAKLSDFSIISVNCYVYNFLLSCFKSHRACHVLTAAKKFPLKDNELQ